MPSELGLPSGPRQYLTSEFPTVRKYWAEGVRVALKLYDKSNRNVFNVCSGAAPFTGEPSIVAASRIRMACAESLSLVTFVGSETYWYVASNATFALRVVMPKVWFRLGMTSVNSPKAPSSRWWLSQSRITAIREYGKKLVVRSFPFTGICPVASSAEELRPL